MSALSFNLLDYILIDRGSASSLGMMSEEEKKLQRIEDIKELLS